MLHVYQNFDGELVVADTAEQAGTYHDCELGGNAEIQGDWDQVPDAAVIPIRDSESETTEKKPASEWAAEYDKPTQIATTYT